MSDILEYLKSIDERTARIEDHIDDLRHSHDNRIWDLEKKEERRMGVMVGGGAVVTFLSGIAAWVVDHLSHNG